MYLPVVLALLAFVGSTVDAAPASYARRSNYVHTATASATRTFDTKASSPITTGCSTSFDGTKYDITLSSGTIIINSHPTATALPGPYVAPPPEDQEEDDVLVVEDYPVWLDLGGIHSFPRTGGTGSSAAGASATEGAADAGGGVISADESGVPLGVITFNGKFLPVGPTSHVADSRRSLLGSTNSAETEAGAGGLVTAHNSATISVVTINGTFATASARLYSLTQSTQ